MVFEAHTKHVPTLLFTHDSNLLISGGMDNMVKVWSVPSWELFASLEGHTKSVNTLSLSPDGATLASGSSDMTVKLWSIAEGQLLRGSKIAGRWSPRYVSRPTGSALRLASSSSDCIGIASGPRSAIYCRARRVPAECSRSGT